MKRNMLIVVSVVVLVLLSLYGIFWLVSGKTYDVEYGVSFNKQHAESLDLDWQRVYLAMLNELKPKYIRISATWKETEGAKGRYDFDGIDWQMIQAAKKGVGVTLVVGQKAPRWPECHVPDWANDLQDKEYRRAVKDYMKKVVERYRNHPALELWQVENEPFIKFRFGECDRFAEDLVVEEIELVRSLDQNHKIMVTDSGELSTWIKASKAGDIFGTTVYRIVRTPSGRYWKYDWLPPGFYNLKARLFGRKYKGFFVSELQAEPWFTDSHPNNTPVEEQEKSMNPDRLKKHVEYVQHMGVSRTYLWGIEWWYWMREVKNDDRYWEMIKGVLSD